MCIDRTCYRTSVSFVSPIIADCFGYQANRLGHLDRSRSGTRSQFFFFLSFFSFISLLSRYHLTNSDSLAFDAGIISFILISPRQLP